MKKVRLIYYLIRYMGIGWCLFRVWYALKLKSGWFRRRCPAKPWEDVKVESGDRRPESDDSEEYLEYRRSKDAPRFFFSPEDRLKFQPLFAQWDQETSPVAEADAILAGKFRFYSKTEKEVGFPPDWHRNHFTGEIAPADRHWSELGDFGFGDIKNVWELSRFSWAYTLVRAYWRTGNEKYPEAFWTLFGDWMKKNPPNQGVNWKCGQEISFRVMAWCFALYGFLGSPATTGARLRSMHKAVMESGDRIAANIDYAISQKNNHGISEGMGLWTIGILFPELKKAKVWREQGRRVLEDLAEELIYEDGSFAQHSMNYHRVMLHDYVWSIRLGEVNGLSFSDRLRRKTGNATEFLYQCQDAVSGKLPLYGGNDGALLLPVSNCDYLDYRAVVQAGHHVINQRQAIGSGPWDEESLWLLNTMPPPADSVANNRSDLAATVGGYFVLRDADSFLFTRCCSRFRHRPKNGDFLHVDLWWRGQNISRDAGSYSYNAPSPWGGYFGSARNHNTVMVDGREQMDKMGRFLSMPWIRGEATIGSFETAGREVRFFEGRHQAYERLAVPVQCQRAVLSLGRDTWLVVDRVASRAPHNYRLHWLLGDYPWKWDDAAGRLELGTRHGPFYITLGAIPKAPADAVAGISVRHADEETPRGWCSLYYQAREPAVSCALELHSEAAVFYSVFSPVPCAFKGNRSPEAGTMLEIMTGDQHYEIAVSETTAERLIQSVTASDRFETPS